MAGAELGATCSRPPPGRPRWRSPGPSGPVRGAIRPRGRASPRGCGGRSGRPGRRPAAPRRPRSRIPAAASGRASWRWPARSRCGRRRGRRRCGASRPDRSRSGRTGRRRAPRTAAAGGARWSASDPRRPPRWLCRSSVRRGRSRVGPGPPGARRGEQVRCVVEADQRARSGAGGPHPVHRRVLGMEPERRVQPDHVREIHVDDTAVRDHRDRATGEPRDQVLEPRDDAARAPPWVTRGRGRPTGR